MVLLSSVVDQAPLVGLSATASPAVRNTLDAKELDYTESTSVESVSSDSSVEVEHESFHEPSRRRRESSKSVLFSTVEVREYERVVGDHTDLIGPPLAIGWEYEQGAKESISDYEENRPRRRSEMELIITPTGRRQMFIRNWGYTSSQLSEEERILVHRRYVEEKENKKKEKKGLMYKIGKGMKRSLAAVASSAAMSSSMTPSAGGSPFGTVSPFGS